MRPHPHVEMEENFTFISSYDNEKVTLSASLGHMHRRTHYVLDEIHTKKVFTGIM